MPKCENCGWKGRGSLTTYIDITGEEFCPVCGSEDLQEQEICEDCGGSGYATNGVNKCKRCKVSGYD